MKFLSNCLLLIASLIAFLAIMPVVMLMDFLDPVD